VPERRVYDGEHFIDRLSEAGKNDIR